MTWGSRLHSEHSGKGIAFGQVRGHQQADHGPDPEAFPYGPGPEAGYEIKPDASILTGTASVVFT